MDNQTFTKLARKVVIRPYDCVLLVSCGVCESTLTDEHGQCSTLQMDL